MVRLVVFIWLGIAFVVGATGALRQSPIPPPGIAVALTIAALLVIRLSPRARAGVHDVGPGPFVLFHLVRIAAGAYFLVLGARGALPAGAHGMAAGSAAGLERRRSARHPRRARQRRSPVREESILRRAVHVAAAGDSADVCRADRDRVARPAVLLVTCRQGIIRPARRCGRSSVFTRTMRGTGWRIWSADTRSMCVTPRRGRIGPGC